MNVGLDRFVDRMTYDHSIPVWIRTITFWARRFIELIFNVDTTTSRERKTRKWYGQVKHKVPLTPRERVIKAIKFQWQHGKITPFKDTR